MAIQTVNGGCIHIEIDAEDGLTHATFVFKSPQNPEILDKVKLIRFGQQGVSGSPKKDGESAAAKARREAFKARHASNIAKGKMSAAYWADKTKW